MSTASATIPGVPVTDHSMIFASIQNYVPGVFVVAVVPVLTGSSNSFTIHLNKAPGTVTPVRVAFLVIERP
jgi:hypothetical protein